MELFLKPPGGGLFRSSRLAGRGRAAGHGSGAHAEWLEGRVLLAAAPLATSTVPAKQDAFVRDGTYARQNAGRDTTLTVKKDAVGFTRQSFLTFSTSAPASDIARAVVRLYGRATPGGTPVSVSLYAVPSTTWSESTVTWTNKPPTSGVPLG